MPSVSCPTNSATTSGLPHPRPGFPERRQATDYILNGQSVDELDGDRASSTTPRPTLHRFPLPGHGRHAVTLAGRPLPWPARTSCPTGTTAAAAGCRPARSSGCGTSWSSAAGVTWRFTVVPPSIAPTLLGQLAGLQRRLADLVAERDAAVAPADRRRLSLAVTRLRSQVRRVQGRAAPGAALEAGRAFRAAAPS